MTAPDTPPPPRRRLRLVLVALLLIVVATFWWISELYTTDAARACQELYAGAKTAVDSGRIGLIVPATLRGRKPSDSHTCADLRSPAPQ